MVVYARMNMNSDVAISRRGNLVVIEARDDPAPYHVETAHDALQILYQLQEHGLKVPLFAIDRLLRESRSER